MQKPIITIKNLRKAFPKREGRRATEALHDIDLTIYENEFLMLLGPSGCGKSTFLRILAELDKETSGSVERDPGFTLDHMSFVFQNFGILPWLTVAQNVELGLIGRAVPEHERIHNVKEILEIFELAEAKNHLPFELSGGMKQRVGLARAFVTKPSIIFLDEPFSELDFFTASHLRTILVSMWEKEKTTVVMVSHYIEEAVALADRIVIFNDRPGRIEEIIENTLPRPRNPRSKEFYALEDTVRGYFEAKK